MYGCITGLSSVTTVERFSNDRVQRNEKGFVVGGSPIPPPFFSLLERFEWVFNIFVSSPLRVRSETWVHGDFNVLWATSVTYSLPKTCCGGEGAKGSEGVREFFRFADRSRSPAETYK